VEVELAGYQTATVTDVEIVAANKTLQDFTLVAE
jgi:hypothetical protein